MHCIETCKPAGLTRQVSGLLALPLRALVLGLVRALVWAPVLGLVLGLALMLMLAAGCTDPVPATPPVAPAVAPPAASADVPTATLPASAVAPTAVPEATHRGPAQPHPRYVQLAPPVTPINAAELRLQFATRLVAAHPDTSYMQRAPDRLWAIPVLEVELHANGDVRRIRVLRKPATGPEATVLAMAAVRRAAPFGDVSRLPKPWKVVETFLFDDELRFKPRTLDID